MPSALVCASALALSVGVSSAPVRAQSSDEKRDFYLQEVLRGETGNVRCLLLDRHGTLWVGAQAGLFALRNGALVRVAGDARTGMVNALLEAQESVWAGGENGLFRVAGDSASGVPGPKLRLVYALSEFRGSLWVGARNGLFQLEAGALRERLDADAGAVTALLADGDTLWIGRNGLLRLGAAGIEPVAGPDTGGVRALVRSGPALFVGGDAGVFRVAGGGLERIEGDPTGRVYALAAAPGGGAWIGGFDGLFALEAGRSVQRGSAELKGVLALRADPDTLWIGALRGLFRKPEAGAPAAVPGAVTGWVTALVRDGDALWIGAENGLFRLRGKDLVRIPVDKPPAAGGRPAVGVPGA